MSERVLFVDDDKNILAAYRRHLRKRFDFHTAVGPEEALALVRETGPFAVVVSDMQMPGMNGVELLGELKARCPLTVRMMLTGNADQQTAVEAVNDGSIFRFYTKPCSPETLSEAIRAALAQYRLIAGEKELLERTLAGSVKVLVDVLSLVDPAAFGRTQALRDLVREVAPRLGQDSLWQLDMAAMLSPVGMITLPGDVVEKLRAGQTLTGAETEMVSRVPEIGRDLIANIPRLQDVGQTIYYQAKGFDGSGFPKDGVAGEDIPLGARILRPVADLLDVAMGEPPDGSMLGALNRKLYDPKVLDALETVLPAAQGDAGETTYSHLKVVFMDLKPGDLLVGKIETDSGQLILSEGNEITEAQLEKLRNLWRVGRIKEPFVIRRLVERKSRGAKAPVKARTETPNPAKAVA